MLPVTGKIVTKLRYSYFFRKVTKLLKKLQVTQLLKYTEKKKCCINQPDC